MILRPVVIAVVLTGCDRRLDPVGALGRAWAVRVAAEGGDEVAMCWDAPPESTVRVARIVAGMAEEVTRAVTPDCPVGICAAASCWFGPWREGDDWIVTVDGAMPLPVPVLTSPLRFLGEAPSPKATHPARFAASPGGVLGVITSDGAVVRLDPRTGMRVRAAVPPPDALTFVGETLWTGGADGVFAVERDGSVSHRLEGPPGAGAVSIGGPEGPAVARGETVWRVSGDGLTLVGHFDGLGYAAPVAYRSGAAYVAHVGELLRIRADGSAEELGPPLPEERPRVMAFRLDAHATGLLALTDYGVFEVPDAGDFRQPLLRAHTVDEWPHGSVPRAVARDPSGGMWVSGRRGIGGAGVGRSLLDANSAELAWATDLWASGGDNLYRIQTATGRVGAIRWSGLAPPPCEGAELRRGGPACATTPDGAWAGNPSGLWRSGTSGEGTEVRGPGGASLAVTTLLADGDTLWVGTSDQGLVRVDGDVVTILGGGLVPGPSWMPIWPWGVRALGSVRAIERVEGRIEVQIDGFRFGVAQ